MTKWEWQEDNIIRGKGELIKKGTLFKSQYIDNLNITIKGKFSYDAKLTSLIKIILREEFEIDDPDLKYLPACVVEIIIKSLVDVNIKNIKSIFVNGKMVEPKYVLSEICELIQDNRKLQEVKFEIQESNMGVKVNLAFNKKRVNGKIEFFDPFSKRSAIKLLEDLTSLISIFEHRKKVEHSRVVGFFEKPRFNRGSHEIPISHYEYDYMRRHNL